MKDPVVGGLVRVPPGVDERHVLLESGGWVLRSALTGADQIREFGGCCLLGSGQMIPADKAFTAAKGST